MKKTLMLQDAYVKRVDIMTEDLIKRINELTAISRERELTDDEQKERELLRAEYIKQFRARMRTVLDNVEIVD